MPCQSEDLTLVKLYFRFCLDDFGYMSSKSDMTNLDDSVLKILLSRNLCYNPSLSKNKTTMSPNQTLSSMKSSPPVDLLFSDEELAAIEAASTAEGFESPAFFICAATKDAVQQRRPRVRLIPAQHLPGLPFFVPAIVAAAAIFISLSLICLSGNNALKPGHSATHQYLLDHPRSAI